MWSMDHVIIAHMLQYFTINVYMTFIYNNGDEMYEVEDLH